MQYLLVQMLEDDHPPTTRKPQKKRHSPEKQTERQGIISIIRPVVNTNRRMQRYITLITVGKI